MSGFISPRLAAARSLAILTAAMLALAGMVVAVMRRGEVAFAETVGKADVERNKPMRPDTIVRIYSMTKPLTSTAIMMLYEEGRFQLDDPISKFIPAFKNPRVYAGGSRGKIDSVPAEREITFRDLLTHTSGLTYGFMESTPVDAVYRDQKIDFGTATASLADVVERLAAVPLIAQPGKAWNYSVATDVLGYLVQVISGQPFDVFLREKVLKPLRMLDTDFIVAKDKQERFATCYMPGKDGKLAVMDDPTKSTYLAPRKGYSGGGGLAGTAGDYLRFCKFMLNKGELDGVRLLAVPTAGPCRIEDVRLQAHGVDHERIALPAPGGLAHPGVRGAPHLGEFPGVPEFVADGHLKPADVVEDALKLLAARRFDEPPRILIAGYQHETNTFAPSLADWAAFTRGDSFPPFMRGEAMLKPPPT